jgi:hypothetical protein
MVLLQDWLASGLDSGCGIHGGFHWLQTGLRSPGYPPRSPPAKCLFYCVISGVQGWIPRGVASQKNRSDAGDMPRCAPQHTFSARKEPENNGLAVCLSPVRLPVDPKNRRHPRTPSAACHSPFEPSGPRSGFRFGLWGPPRNPSCVPMPRDLFAHDTDPEKLVASISEIVLPPDVPPKSVPQTRNGLTASYAQGRAQPQEGSGSVPLSSRVR